MKNFNILDEKTLKETLFVHYGDDMFDPNKIQRIKFYQNHFNKPKVGGLWFSPKGSKFGWREWVKISGFDRFKNNFRWEVKLNPKAKILNLKSILDLKDLPTSDLCYDGIFACKYYDWGKVEQMGFDGVFLTFNLLTLIKQYQKYYEGSPVPTLRFWDCETLLLFSDDKIDSVVNYVQTID